MNSNLERILGPRNNYGYQAPLTKVCVYTLPLSAFCGLNFMFGVPVVSDGIVGPQINNLSPV